MNDAVLFDARNPGWDLLPFPLPFVILGLAGFGLFRTLKAIYTGRRDAMKGARNVPFLVLLIVVSIAATVPMLIGFWAGRELDRGEFQTVEGCPTKFERIVHPNAHNIADTYFNIQGKDFHFNSSPWLPGFHNDQDLIKSGDHLRISSQGNMVLKVERLPTPCSQ